MNFVNFKPIKSKLTINENLIFHFQKDKPNWFWRMMHRIFFGFKWEDIGKVTKEKIQKIIFEEPVKAGERLHLHRWSRRRDGRQCSGCGEVELGKGWMEA